MSVSIERIHQLRIVVFNIKLRRHILINVLYQLFVFVCLNTLFSALCDQTFLSQPFVLSPLCLCHVFYCVHV